ncbi:MAG: WbuC family cupin fold metalloprotein [Rhodocyclales bacterium]|nr:WbuC family cupin fold metalloprotein [Rhodocyclales bacterium]MBI5785430.1 WbuC family cupin fold metalloprotein [Rhodocyclales bacterium]
MKQITAAMLHSLAAQAQASPRRRANLNLHERLDDPIQRLAIAMEPDTYVRPHRHPQTWELLYPLTGQFLVLHFDAAGRVMDRTLLGADSRIVETPAGGWHAVLSLNPGAVIFEVKHGPYAPIAEADYAPWSPAAETPGVAQLTAWYATARVGERWRP